MAVLKGKSDSQHKKKDRRGGGREGKLNNVLIAGHAAYLFDLDPQFASVIFKVHTRLFGIKVNFKRKYKQYETCPFCRNGNENIQYVFSCENGLRHKRSLDNATLYNMSVE